MEDSSLDTDWKIALVPLADDVAAERDADVYFYLGDLRYEQDEIVFETLCKSRRAKKVWLILVTLGGDPHVAYRIARFMRRAYEHVSVVVSGECKSAGTLLAIAASELVMADLGELGPLDVQMEKKGEIYEVSSGLIVQSSLRFLNESAFHAFDHIVTQCRRRRMSTQLAADVAVRLTSGIFQGIYSQIDPLHAGETARNVAIASHYGRRLAEDSQNLHPAALSRLISDYPTHGFVIDREEASTLFKNVRPPSEKEQRLLERLGDLARHQFTSSQQVIFEKLSSDPSTKPIGSGAQESEDPDAQVAPTGIAAPPNGGPQPGGPASASEDNGLARAPARSSPAPSRA